jgi:hypothetical protein
MGLWGSKSIPRLGYWTRSQLATRQSLPQVPEHRVRIPATFAHEEIRHQDRIEAAKQQANNPRAAKKRDSNRVQPCEQPQLTAQDIERCLRCPEKPPTAPRPKWTRTGPSYS